MTSRRLMGFVMSASVTLAGSGCGRRNEPGPERPPTLVSEAPSIEIRVLEQNRAMYKPALHNKSPKDVVAFAFVRDDGNGNRVMNMSQSSDLSHALIPAGTTYAREVPWGSPTVLAAALFADTSHEGDSEIAAILYASQLGAEIQKGRADPLIRGIISDRTPDDAGKIAQIRLTLGGLPTAPEDSALRLMQDAFPDLLSDTLKKQLAQGLEQGKHNLWSSLYEFEHQNSVYPKPKTHPPIEHWWTKR